ncbi:Uncharacterised protein [Clostridium tertium]|uniref:Phage conserved hypothetical protein C-terminal domain-containing protein n=1 Tax=Clostridium tertium TaxID=1559 RepID=A0A6N2ZMH0_9CLOT
MQFSFLGFSVKKVMELQLDVKDLAILRYFQDFMKSGKMNYEEVGGVKYYWVSYKNISDEMPFLGLGKRTIMMRMLRLRDLGLLAHYTKKEGGTFSYYTLGDKFNDLLYTSENRSLSKIEDENKNSRKKLNGQFIDKINLNSRGEIRGQGTSYMSSIDGQTDSGRNSNVRGERIEQVTSNIDSMSGQAVGNINLNNKENSILNNSNSKDNIISGNPNSKKTIREETLDYGQNSDEQSEKSIQVNFEYLIKNREDNTDRNESKTREEMNYGEATFNKEAKGEMLIVENDNSIIGGSSGKEDSDSSIGQSALSEKNISKIGQAILDKSIKQTPGQAISDKSIEKTQTLAQDKLTEINKNSINNKEEDRSISEYPNQNNKDLLSKEMNRGCSSNDTTKTNLLNNLTTLNTNDLKSIKDKLEFILNYLNIRANVNYRITNRKTVGLITARLREGFTAEDFKIVIDKKVSEWSGTNFEQYLNPFTLFGEKFELYLNQKVISKNNNGNGGVGNSKEEKFYKSDTRKLRFHNFTGREVDYESIEKQLLGWE